MTKDMDYMDNYLAMREEYDLIYPDPLDDPDYHRDIEDYYDIDDDDEFEEAA